MIWVMIISIPNVTKANETDAIIKLCQEASERYSSFSYYWDRMLLNSILNFPAGSKERQTESQKVIDEANALIEKELDVWFKANQKIISEQSDSYRKQLLILANKKRELTILSSFVFVAENAKNNQLGKSEGHYKRRLFDECIK